MSGLEVDPVLQPPVICNPYGIGRSYCRCKVEPKHTISANMIKFLFILLSYYYYNYKTRIKIIYLFMSCSVNEYFDYCKQ